MAQVTGLENVSSDLLPDPFASQASNGSDQRRSSHRYSAFDTNLFSHYQPSASPSQVKRALEAHLTETDRRLEEASKLGTSLVQQRKDLSDQLKEVESQQGEREISPELRQKLVDVEKEYNELGRDSARAFLAPKSRHLDPNDLSNGNGLDVRSASPTKFISQATDSPSKLNVPSRKQRNQPASRVHDIEFATEISTSLLDKVRQLQAVLAERDDSLKRLGLEKSQLEVDTQNYAQRIKTLDESEQRYKDENWSLETQTHDLIAKAKDSAAQEQRLLQSLALLTSEKNTAQRELDDIKQAHGTLAEDHAALRKIHDSEVAGLRKHASLADNDKGSLQRKIEDLSSQNQELAKAVAGRFKGEGDESLGEIGSDPEELALDRSDREHSPPPSPSKGPVRNSMLESETLKSSLHHAHRMIQTLKSNIHREKTEKLELKRLLQETRDELEVRRVESNTNNKRAKNKSQTDVSKKAPKLGQLGVGRSSRTDIEMNDPDWEDHSGEAGSSNIANARAVGDPLKSDASDAYQTANETEDAFETANERDSTEGEAFQTGAEDAAADSGDSTETEGAAIRSNTVRRRNVSAPQNIKRLSYVSTASTSDGEGDREQQKTPVQSAFSNLKYRLKLGRGSRRSRIGSEGPEESPASAKDSPASFISNRSVKGQSLAAELGDLGADSGEEDVGTPSKSDPVSRRTTPGHNSSRQLVEPTVARVPTTDSGMMTEAWEPQLPTQASTVTPQITPRKTQDQGIQGTPVPLPLEDPATPYQSRDVGAQGTPIPEPTKFEPVQPTDMDNSSRHARRTTQILTAKAINEATTEASALPQLSFSEIHSTTTEPLIRTAVPAGLYKPFSSSNAGVGISPVVVKDPTPINIREDEPTVIDDQAVAEPSNSTDDVKDAAAAGMIGSVLGWAMGKRQSTPQPEAAETSQRVEDAPAAQAPVAPETKTPFRELSPNIMQREKEPAKLHTPVEKADQSSQTLLSADQIDTMMAKGHKATFIAPIATGKPGSPQFAREVSPRESSAAGPRPIQTREVMPPARSMKRPGSTSSVRTATADVPPLPIDHQQAIAAASQGPSVQRQGAMGPPVMPASAYRTSMGKRPITPNDQATQSQSAVTPTTPRHRYSSARSARSRRSSVSSFESELDARFNIRADGMPLPQGLDSGTDPRMIQAITQTMIGEYLWKYTRKPGRSNVSDNRHRRFFWIHPYTRTLYWSDQDPSTAGRAQLKAKSVAIEAVRVVVDDNPMPPGLHRKSLIVISPGRDIKFTATTGQRHETWFNALSYLLLRSNPQALQNNTDGLTAEDVAEFNPAYARNSRTSLSTYNSRTNTTRNSHLSSRNHSPSKGSVRRIPISTPQASASSRYSDANQTSSLGSRLSSLMRPARASSGFANGKAPTNNNNRESAMPSGGIYDAAPVANDSAEDVRQVLEKQEEEADRLENVRACCDGKHDVGSLNRRSTMGGKLGTAASRHSHHGHAH